MCNFEELISKEMVCSVEVELELEGAAVLEVVEGAGVLEAVLALRLGVQRVRARVELRALLGVRQHLHTDILYIYIILSELYARM